MEIQAIASKSMRVIPKHVSSGDWVIGLAMVLVANCWLQDVSQGQTVSSQAA